MTGNLPFPMKDVVLVGVLKQDVVRALPDVARRDQPRGIRDRRAGETEPVTVTK
jgi:hypothetical protein